MVHNTNFWGLRVNVYAGPILGPLGSFGGQSGVRLSASNKQDLSLWEIHQTI